MLIGWIIPYTYKTSRYIGEMNMQSGTQQRKPTGIVHCNNYNFAFCPYVRFKKHKKWELHT